MIKIISVSKTTIWNGIEIQKVFFENLLEVLRYSNLEHKVNFINLETNVQLSISVKPKLQKEGDIKIVSISNARFFDNAFMPERIFEELLWLLLFSNFVHTVEYIQNNERKTASTHHFQRR